MRTDLIGGVWPAVLTPFDARGDLSGAEMARHFAETAATDGVRAIVVNGHAGEATALSRAERREVVAVARSACGRGTGVVAGIVADAPREAVGLARDAAEAGADALLVFPPPVLASAGARRPEMALRFLRDIAEASGLPLVLFQLPVASGHGFSTETLGQLCREVESIVAVKEGSDVPATYEDTLATLRRLERQVAVFTTNNTWLMASLAYGADGILSGAGSVAAPILVDLLAAMERGDLAAARAANARFLPLARVFYRSPGCDTQSRMKTALHLLGRLPHPDPRPPLLPIAPAERAEIAAALRAAGLLADAA